MFERFTEDARRVVVYAPAERRLLCHDHIGTEHLLLGLLHDDTSTGVALGDVGVSLVGARDWIGRSQGRGSKEAHGHIPFTPRAKRVLERSLPHARRLGQAVVARPHMLLALLDVRDGVAAQTLVECGVDLEALGARADELGSRAESEPGSEIGPSVVAGRPTVSTSRHGWQTLHLHSQVVPEAGDGLAPQLDDATGQPDAVANALHRYGRHDEGCDVERGCSCGLRTVLDGFEPLATD